MEDLVRNKDRIWRGQIVQGFESNMESLYFILKTLGNIFRSLNRGPRLQSYNKIDVVIVYR